MGITDDPRMKELSEKILDTPTGAERNKLTMKQIRLAEKIGQEERQKLIFLNRSARRLAELGECNFTTTVKGWKIEIKTEKTG